MTLCGCLKFPEERVRWRSTQKEIRWHFRRSPGCRERAMMTPIWQWREPIGDKCNLGDERDPDYEQEIAADR